jgi:hypothetical protein
MMVGPAGPTYVNDYNALVKSWCRFDGIKSLGFLDFAPTAILNPAFNKRPHPAPY